jgi:hypothetical protein
VEGKTDEAMDWWGHVGLYQQPFSRNLSIVYEPAIWVDSQRPAKKLLHRWKCPAAPEFFEATVNIRLVDNIGKTIAEGFTTASEGAPGRGVLNIRWSSTTHLRDRASWKFSGQAPRRKRAGQSVGPGKLVI